MAWFSTRGQVLQTVVAIVGVVFSGVKAWPDIRNSRLFSGGAIYFYFLAALLCLILWNLYRLASAYRPVTTQLEQNDKPTKEREIVKSEIVLIDTTNDPKIVYKNKLRCILKNVSDSTISVHRVAWLTTKDGAGTQTPFAAMFQRETSLGSWQNQQWNKQELEEIDVQPGWTFRVWIGLDSTASRDWLEKKKNTKQLGTLLLPISIANQSYKVEIPV